MTSIAILPEKQKITDLFLNLKTLLLFLEQVVFRSTITHMSFPNFASFNEYIEWYSILALMMLQTLFGLTIAFGVTFEEIEI